MPPGFVRWNTGIVLGSLRSWRVGGDNCTFFFKKMSELSAWTALAKAFFSLSVIGNRRRAIRKALKLKAFYDASTCFWSQEVYGSCCPFTVTKCFNWGNGAEVERQVTHTHARAHIQSYTETTNFSSQSHSDKMTSLWTVNETWTVQAEALSACTWDSRKILSIAAWPLAHTLTN